MVFNCKANEMWLAGDRCSESAGGGSCLLSRFKPERQQGSVPELRNDAVYQRDLNQQPSLESARLVVGNLVRTRIMPF